MWLDVLKGSYYLKLLKTYPQLAELQSSHVSFTKQGQLQAILNLKVSSWSNWKNSFSFLHFSILPWERCLHFQTSSHFGLQDGTLWETKQAFHFASKQAHSSLVVLGIRPIVKDGQDAWLGLAPSDTHHQHHPCCRTMQAEDGQCMAP